MHVGADWEVLHLSHPHTDLGQLAWQHRTGDMAGKEGQLTPLLTMSDSHLLYEKNLSARKLPGRRLWRSRNVTEGYSVKHCLLLEPVLCAQMGKMSVVLLWVLNFQVKRHVSDGAIGFQISKADTKNDIKRICYFTVFQEAEIKLISYNMFYELTQMRDTGPDPDCTKFPNVISHVVHFAIS